MEKTSLKKRIVKYLFQRPDWTHGGEIERLALNANYKASNAGRRCRELVNDNILEPDYRKGEVWYRYKVENKG